MTSKLLQDVLPIDELVNTFTIRRHVADVAERLEQELGDEQFCFVEGRQRSWDELPSPDGPLTVGIDGGYVRGQHKQGQFEVIAGKSLLAFKRDQEGKQQLSARCFAWVQTYDEKPKRRLFELLQSQGMQPNQQVNFLSDGGEDVRNVQLYLNPQAEHLLDWFHLTMRLTVLNQTAKGFPINVGIIRATTGDPDGNLTMEKEALTLEALAIAMAARNSGGIVIAQGERVAESGSLNPSQVKVPGVLVDCVVVARPENHWQTLRHAIQSRLFLGDP